LGKVKKAAKPMINITAPITIIPIGGMLFEGTLFLRERDGLRVLIGDYLIFFVHGLTKAPKSEIDFGAFILL